LTDNRQVSRRAGARPGIHQAELEKQFGFDKPPLERFLLMLWNYARFDFGESYFRDIRSST
jgi:ABC-type microcin C transport system permease subunit YejB